MAHILTDDILKNACTYVPILEKARFVAEAATECFERVEITLGDERSTPFYKENGQVKSRWLMGAFVLHYLKQPIEPVEGTSCLLSADDYDRWAGAHVFGQLERMKTKPEWRDRIFDLLVDYRDMEKRLNGEIRSLLKAMNDPISRMLMQASGQMTPENLQNMSKELSNLQVELEELVKKRKSGVEQA